MKKLAALVLVLMLVCALPMCATITAGTGTTCYVATTCTQTGIASGQSVAAFAGSTASGTTLSLSLTNSSFSVQSAFINVGGAHIARGIISIANSTSTAVSTTNCGSDCGLEIQPYSSTTTFDSTTAQTNTASQSGSPQSLALVTTTGATSWVIGYVVDENGATLGAGTGWTKGPFAATHADITVYKTNQAAAGYQPVITTSDTATTVPSVSLALSETAAAAGSGGFNKKRKLERLDP